MEGRSTGRGRSRPAVMNETNSGTNQPVFPAAAPGLCCWGGVGAPSESPTAPTWLSLEVEQKPMGMAGSGRPRKGEKKKSRHIPTSHVGSAASELVSSGQGGRDQKKIHT